MTTIFENVLRRSVRIYNVSFQYLKDTLDKSGVLLIAERLTADPSYKVRRDAGKPGSDYDIFTKKMSQKWWSFMKIF